MSKGLSKCKYCGKIIPSVSKVDHLENKCIMKKFSQCAEYYMFAII